MIPTYRRLLGSSACLLALVAPLQGQGLPRGNPAALGFSSQRLARIDRVMQQYVDSGKVAGVVTLIARHGQVAYSARPIAREGGR